MIRQRIYRPHELREPWHEPRQIASRQYVVERYGLDEKEAADRRERVEALAVLYADAPADPATPAAGIDFRQVKPYRCSDCGQRVVLSPCSICVAKAAGDFVLSDSSL